MTDLADDAALAADLVREAGLLARRMRAEMTSIPITMATMSRITVAASRSLNERIVSQR